MGDKKETAAERRKRLKQERQNERSRQKMRDWMEETARSTAEIRSNIPMASKDRLALMNCFKEYQHLLEPCHFTEFIDLLPTWYLGRAGDDSAADSIITYAQWKYSPYPLDIMLKFSFEPSDEHEEYLRGILPGPAVEAEILEKVTNPLIINRHTPHILVLIGRLRCNLNEMNRNDPDVKQFKWRLKRAVKSYELDREDWDLNHLNILLTRFIIDAMPLYDFVDTDWWDKEWVNITFQIVWTLACFKEVGLMHNDMHTGNILIQELAHEQDMYYVTRTKTYKLRTRFAARVIDFDQGYKEKTQLSPFRIMNGTLIVRDYSDWCRFNEFNPYFDLSKILLGIYRHDSRGIIEPLLLDTFKTVNDLKWAVRMSDRTVLNDLCSRKNIPNLKKRMKTPHQLLAYCKTFKPLESKYMVDLNDPNVFTLPSVES